MEANTAPKTLQEAIMYFANPDNCLKFLASRRWPNGVVACPRCGSKNVGFIASRRVWQCKIRHPSAQFSIKVGTIFEDSPLGLEKWLPALWMVGNDQNGVSSWELHRALGVTQKTAWFMLHRIRLALQDTTTGGSLCGEIAVDETFMDGKTRNMHKATRGGKIGNCGAEGKAIFAPASERGGEVRAKVVTNRRTHELHSVVRHKVQAVSVLYCYALNRMTTC